MVGLRRYLRDYAEAIKSEHTRRWASGTMMSPQEEEKQATWAQILLELEGLQYDHIAKFYDIALPPSEESEENDEPQTEARDD
jgi:hypothetical protein